MKLEVIAYLTSTINSYERQIKRQLTPTALTPTYKRVVEDLHDLLDYIVDSKENVQATHSELLDLNAKLIEDKRLMSKNLAMQEVTITTLAMDLREDGYKYDKEIEQLKKDREIFIKAERCFIVEIERLNIENQKLKNTAKVWKSKWDENISC